MDNEVLYKNRVDRPRYPVQVTPSQRDDFVRHVETRRTRHVQRLQTEDEQNRAAAQVQQERWNRRNGDVVGGGGGDDGRGGGGGRGVGVPQLNPSSTASLGSSGYAHLYGTGLGPAAAPLDVRGRSQYEKVTLVSINSGDRDQIYFPFSNDFKVILPNRFTNVCRMRLVSTEFPNVEQTIQAGSHAFRWFNLEDMHTTTTTGALMNATSAIYTTPYEAQIPQGNYTCTTLAAAIQVATLKVLRRQKSYSPFDDTSIFQSTFFQISLDSASNTTTVSQFNRTRLKKNKISTTINSAKVSVVWDGVDLPALLKKGDTFYLFTDDWVGQVSPTNLTGIFTVLEVVKGGGTFYTVTFNMAQTAPATENGGGGENCYLGTPMPFKLDWSSSGGMDAVLGFPSRQMSSVAVTLNMSLMTSRTDENGNLFVAGGVSQTQLSGVYLTIREAYYQLATSTNPTHRIILRFNQTWNGLSVGSYIKIAGIACSPTLATVQKSDVFRVVATDLPRGQGMVTVEFFIDAMDLSHFTTSLGGFLPTATAAASEIVPTGFTKLALLSTTVVSTTVLRLVFADQALVTAGTADSSMLGNLQHVTNIAYVAGRYTLKLQNPVASGTFTGTTYPKKTTVVISNSDSNPSIDGIYLVVKENRNVALLVESIQVEPIPLSTVPAVAGQIGSYAWIGNAAANLFDVVSDPEGVWNTVINTTSIVQRFAPLSNVLYMELPLGLGAFTSPLGDPYVGSVRFANDSSGFATSQQNTTADGSIYAPINLAGDHYLYLCIKNIGTMASTSNAAVPDIFAKLILNEAPISWLYNAFVSSVETFHDLGGLLQGLNDLRISVRRRSGALFNLKNTDYSFTLEITEIADILANTWLASGRVETKAAIR